MPSDREPLPAPPSLGHLQRWMLAATTHPGGLPAGLAQAQADQGLRVAEVVDTPYGVDPRSRVAIYATGYWLRLVACLQAEYPAVSRLLGDELFALLARAYLHAHPSTSPSLHALGAGFPGFLRRSQRSRPERARQAFPVELARLERALAEAGHAQGLEQAAPAPPVDAVALLYGSPCVLRLPATTRLLDLTHALDGFRPWLAGATPHDPPPAGRSYAAVHRHRYRVAVEPLADWQFFALRHARRRPRSLAECARAAARRTGRAPGELQAQLALWLPGAQACSLVALTAVASTPGPPRPSPMHPVPVSRKWP